MVVLSPKVIIELTWLKCGSWLMIRASSSKMTMLGSQLGDRMTSTLMAVLSCVVTGLVGRHVRVSVCVCVCVPVFV
jgi:hypothetical protein